MFRSVVCLIDGKLFGIVGDFLAHGETQTLIVN